MFGTIFFASSERVVFDDTSKPRSSFQVANVGFDRADNEGLLTIEGEDCPNGTRFWGISSLRTGAVSFKIRGFMWGKSRVFERCPYQLFLSRGVGYSDTFFLTIVITSSTANYCSNTISVQLSGGLALQDHCANTFPTNVT